MLFSRDTFVHIDAEDFKPTPLTIFFNLACLDIRVLAIERGEPCVDCRSDDSRWRMNKLG
jgi:hypothetical protein